jgi:cytochrome c biogenesis protein CcmG/thiol:disulfide interchange protein DsbE
MRRLVYLLPVLFLGGLVAFFYRGLQINPSIIPPVLVNQPAPPMDLPALPGSKGLKSADLLGHVSVVDVFGSWCIACAEEHPTLVGIARTGVVPIYGIDWADVPSAAVAWLHRHGNPYARIGMDPSPSPTVVAFGVTGAPESFIIDKKGIIRFKRIGPITPEIWLHTMLPIVRELQK